MGGISGTPIYETVCVQTEQRVVGFKPYEPTETPAEFSTDYLSQFSNFNRDDYIPPPGFEWMGNPNVIVPGPSYDDPSEVPVPPAGWMFLTFVIFVLICIFKPHSKRWFRG